jgi:signal transduction histidine kinase
VRISDHGHGIPLAERERIFEPFARGSNDEGGPGTGLGLAIARGFTQLNGGRLWIESGPDAGTTFALALPAAKVPTAAAR